MRYVRDRGLKIESVRAERRAQEEGREQRQEPEAGSTVFNSFLEFTGGAWPFLVGGLPCQVDSGNERDLSLLNSQHRTCGAQTS